MAAQIQIRRGNSTDWQSANPTPALAEPCIETDTNRLKIGDGVTAWNDLDYFPDNISEFLFKGIINFLQAQKIDILGGPGGGLSLEGEKHFITTNDGGGNFNIRIGHYYDNDNSYNVMTEGGRALHIVFSQSTGKLEFKIGPDLLIDNTFLDSEWEKEFSIDATGDAQNFLPVGFTYIQFPGTPDPNSLLGGTWATYSGVPTGCFFRNEGGDAKSFNGGVQASNNLSHNHGPGTLSGRYNMRGNDNSETGKVGAVSYVYDAFNSWSTDGAVDVNDGLTGDRGTTESRPQNVTVRIWEKIS